MPADRNDRFTTCRSPLIISTLLIGVLSSWAAWAQENDVNCPVSQGLATTNILFRVFPIRIDQTGTAFTLEVRGQQYIVTADHLLEGEFHAEIEVQLGSDEWTRIPVSLVGQGEHQDVLVMTTVEPLTPTFPADAGTGRMVVGQSVRFLGFMPRARTQPLPGYERGMPLIMGGVLSGFDNRHSLLIDGQGNKGFSGGPVVYQPVTAPTFDECRWRIAGVITSYLHVPVRTEGDALVVTEDNQSVVANSGLLVATRIETVLGIIEKAQDR